ICEPMTLPARSKLTCLPPAPRSFHTWSGMSHVFGTKFTDILSPQTCPLLLKYSSSHGGKRSEKTKSLAKMKVRLCNRFIMKGALVTAKNLTEAFPCPLKCWYSAFRGIANKLPGCHSKVCFLPFCCHTEVAPCPSRI